MSSHDIAHVREEDSAPSDMLDKWGQARFPEGSAELIAKLETPMFGPLDIEARMKTFKNECTRIEADVITMGRTRFDRAFYYTLPSGTPIRVLIVKEKITAEYWKHNAALQRHEDHVPQMDEFSKFCNDLAHHVL